MGRIKPKTVSELMDIANRFSDGEDACHNKRTRSPEDDRGNRYSNQRQRFCNYDNYGSHSQVAAGYKESNYQGDDRRIMGYRNKSRETRAAIGNISQEVQGNTTNHQTTCSMGHATCTTHTLMTREYHNMQWRIVGHSSNFKKQ
jgi:hypothetical protein